MMQRTNDNEQLRVRFDLLFLIFLILLFWGRTGHLALWIALKSSVLVLIT